MITKKEISDNTISIRGTGFNPNWKYSATIDGILYIKGFVDHEAYVDLRSHSRPIGEVQNKKDFVNKVYDFVNDPDNEKYFDDF